MNKSTFLKLNGITRSFTFGAVFSNEKIILKRVEFWGILQKLQVVELIILT